MNDCQGVVVDLEARKTDELDFGFQVFLCVCLSICLSVDPYGSVKRNESDSFRST